MATLATRLGDLVTAVGTDIKTLRTFISGSSSGTLSGLGTTDKSSLVAAINEVRTVALADVTPAASTTVAGKLETATDAEALAYASTVVALTPSNLAALRGANNGIATLDGSGTIPSSQLPSFVDDVLEFANAAALPATGSAGKIYTTLNDNKIFRWSGSVYVEISGSPGSTDAVPEGSVNLYFTNTRADARADARITAQLGNPDTDLAAAYATAKA